MIKIKNLVGGYANNTIIHHLHIEIEKGEFFALLGPNGSGKTTLFKLITGQLPLQEGTIHIAGKLLHEISALEKARRLAVLSQEIHVSFDYTVEEIISLGRYPHQKGLFKRLAQSDWDMIEHVMDLAKVKQFRHTPFRNISGGEKQRVLLAKALAQEPDVLLLDEPTNHLDIKHTFEMLDLLKAWQQTKGLTIFAILHDLNVASLYADRVALLHEGSFLEVGDVNTLRKEKQLKKAYEVNVKAQSHPTVPKPQLLMTPTHTTVAPQESLRESYTMKRTDRFILMEFTRPLRTLSNSVIGEGIQWLTHFCFVHTDTNGENDLLQWMKSEHIPIEQALGIATSVAHHVFIERVVHGVSIFVLIIAEKIGESDNRHAHSCPIHTTVFIEGDLSDGALADGYMLVAETKAVAKKDICGESSHVEEDHVTVALWPHGQTVVDHAMKKEVRNGIRQAVYDAMKKVLFKNKVTLS